MSYENWKAWRGGVPVLLSSGSWEFLVAVPVSEGGGLEHGENEIAATSGEADDGGVVVLEAPWV